MRKFARSTVLLALAASAAISAAADLPAWAYPVNPPGGAAANDDGQIKQVPDSPRHFVRKELSNISGPVSDWHPAEHPAMPAIVALGRPPAVYACGYCHLPTGAGRPESTAASPA